MSLSLTVLGSGSALPTPKRSSTAQVLKVDERFFLIDCGEGTQVQLKRFGFKPLRFNHIFISHLHGDHIFGLFGLLSSMNLNGRKSPLYLYTQEGHKAILDAVLSDFEFLYELRYKFYDPKKPSVLLDDKGIKVTAFPVTHRTPTVGFLFEEKAKPLNIRKEAIDEFNLSVKDIVQIKAGEDYITPEGNRIKNQNLTHKGPKPASYAFVTDTQYDERIVPHIAGANLLYHDATFAHDLLKMARLTQHSTALQASLIAKKAKVGKLLIGHFSQRYKTVDALLKEAQLEFPNTEAAFDGKTIDIV